jgi:hypothetical protein
MDEELVGYYESREGSIPMNLITENVQLSEHLEYHLENKLSLSNTVFRLGSESWMDLVNEMRSFWEQGLLQVNENDEFILMTEAGRTGVYQGKSVSLDAPRRAPAGEKKKFLVYVNSGRKNAEGRVVAKKITFGYRGLKVRNANPKAAKSFRARHKCSQKTDKTTAGYWACKTGSYAKQLGLTSSASW